MSPRSGIAAYLRAEIDKRGMTDAAFAERADIPKSALSYILTTPGVLPKLDTLDRIAQALEVPLVRLIEVCGFETRPNHARTTDERISAMVEAVPELRGILDHLIPLPSDDLAAIARYVEYYVQDQRRRRAD